MLTSCCILSLVVSIAAYPNGPPPDTCDAMIPFHGPQPQAGTAPYTVTFSKNTYTPGEQIQVTIQGNSNTNFKGFLIEPRKSVTTYQTYGSINTPTGTKNPCTTNGNGKNTALSHSSAADKPSVMFTWTPPSTDQGNIIFVYTVVKTKSVFWVKQESSPLTYQAPTVPPNQLTTQPPTGLPSDSTTQPPSSSTTQPPTQGTIKLDCGCGKSVGCFHDCKGDCKSGSCSFLLKWKDMGDHVDFTLSCKQAGDVFCAIGLSNDEKMGDDSVVECVSNGGTVSATVSYNEGRSNSRLDNSTYGLTQTSSSHQDGVLKCEFSRKKTADLTGRKKRATASSSTYFDLSSDWYLLFAYGTSFSGFISKHTTLPTISTRRADFQSFEDIGAKKLSRVLMQVHGILMTISWMFLVTVGIFSARFFKTVWPEGMEWFGQKRWFLIHRTCMVLVFLCTATAFVVIFVHVGGYAEIEGSGFQKAHPIIGIVVMCLTIINPIMAAFRPHPGTPRRPLFRVAHTIVGVCAQTGGIMNLFTGTALASANLPDYVKILLWVFLGWMLFIDLICHLYNCKNWSKSKGKKGEMYEMKDRPESEVVVTGEVETFKAVILPLHVFVLFGIAVAVCVYIGTGV